MATQRCKHCNGRGEISQCDVCHTSCGLPGQVYGPFSCAFCEADLCDNCYTVNDHKQVICKKHDKKIKVERGSHYINSPQWDGL